MVKTASAVSATSAEEVVAMPPDGPCAPEEEHALRLLARLLVRTHLADTNRLDCAASSKAPLGPMTGDDEP